MDDAATRAVTALDSSEPTAPPADGTEGAAQRRQSHLGEWLSRFSLVFVILAICVLFSAIEPNTFPRYANFTAIVAADAPLLLLALAVTATLRVGDFDLSVSSIMIVSAAVSALLVQHGLGAEVAIPCAIVTALGVGLVNSILVVWWGLDSFITTLGTMTAATGLGYALTSANVISGYGGALVSIARTQVVSVPMDVIYGWILVGLLYYLFEWTVVGRQWLFSGGNREAALLLGLPVRGLRTSAYCLGAVLSGVAGVLLAGSLGSVDPSAGGEYLLTPFAAAFLGTIAVSVGRFNVLGTVLGLYTLGIGEAGLELLGAPPWISNVFDGATLIAALGFAALVQRGKANAARDLIRRRFSRHRRGVPAPHRSESRL